ncbi:hypothetical protein ACFVSW_08645 [Neobacillus sp. NPDC058068]|uniref:phage baseplate protein n=1 Tax=Neobacillus sp. NPDC058068 TaxID=3346325 RepID=UPI0036DC1015
MTSLNRRDRFKAKKTQKRIWNFVITAIAAAAFFFFLKDFAVKSETTKINPSDTHYRENNPTNDHTPDNSTTDTPPPEQHPEERLLLKNKADHTITLQLADKTVMQSFAVDDVHQQIYVSQVESGRAPEEAESFVITRCTMDGKMLDSMTLKYGGHGTNIGVEVDGDSVYVWSSYNKIAEDGTVTGHDLVRFKYKAGAVYNPSSHALKNFSKLIDPSASIQIAAAVDPINKTLAVRQRSGTKTSVDVYSLTDVLSGGDTKLSTTIVPKNLYYLQGFSLDGDYLYWRTGDTDETRFKDFVTVFNTITGGVVYQKHMTAGIDGLVNESNFREPEGIFLYTKPDTGEKSLFVGVVTGGNGERFNRIHAFSIGE